MRTLVNQITERLRSFIAQRDDLALVVRSPATDAPPLLKILEGLEETSPSDFFWTFSDDFTTPEAYASAVVAAFASKHEAVRLAMEKEGMTPWPLIPPQVLSEQALPAQRLRELAAFSRELLPVVNGGVIVWVFFPLDIASHAAWASLVADVLRHEFPFPWCHHLRFIIREDPAARAVQTLLGTSPRIQWYEPDLSTDAINRSMEEEIANEELPLAERLNTLLVTAGNDYAYKRFPEALEKYEILLQYHAPTGNYAMSALALNGMGEVYEKMGDAERAGECYESALVPASHGDNPPIPIFLNVVLNLANLRLAQERWAEAEAYYDVAQQLATVARNAPVKVRSLENRGVCQQQQGKVDEAIESWNLGAAIAEQLGEAELRRSLLERLQQHYAKTRQQAKEREIRERLDALSKPAET